jgi:HD-like signal output (HDOD) protein
MITEQQFLQQLRSAIHENKITLPTLPEVALRVRDAMEKEEISGRQIAEIVATDGALAARLLQVANSPLYRGRVPIDNIQQAVTRLGNQLVRNLVTSLAMKQMYQATSDTLDKHLHTVWEEGVQVAAISRALAQRLPHLDNEQAMLAGLIHNIGSLPILMMADSDPELLENEAQLDRLVEQLNPVIGTEILEEWNFPESLIKVPQHYQHLDYDGGPQADYVDVVLVAHLQTLPAGHMALRQEWGKIPAFAKIGLEPKVEVVNIEGVAEELNEVKEMFLN